jgi:competence protein ComEC
VSLVKLFSPSNGISLLRSYNGFGAVEIKGIISHDPESSSTQNRLYLSASAIFTDGHWTKITGTALLFVPLYPEYRYGENILVEGIIEDTFSLDNAEYTAYLARQDVFSFMEYPEITVTGYSGNAFLSWLYSTKQAINRSLARILPEPQAALAQGIVTGSRSNIPVNLKEAFSSTGTTHLLAISGVNLTIVAGILSTWALRIIGRRYHIYIWITACIVFLYSWLTGLQPPVVRAAVMVSFFLAANLFGRQKSGIIALLLTAVIMTAINPELLFDASTQMSFLAMTGLIIITPSLQQGGQNIVERIVPDNKFRVYLEGGIDSLTISLGAMITTWPLVAYYFDVFSWIGPLATFLALPVIPAIIITSMIAGGLGLFVFPLAQIAGMLAWLPLSYLLLVVTSLARLPGITVETKGLSLKIIILYYSLLVLVVLCRKEYRRLVLVAAFLRPYLSRFPVKWMLVSLAAITLLVWSFALTIPDENVHVSFLDVGQGDAILIEKGTQQILVDGGPNPQATILALSKKIPFWDRHIDMLVLTHPDTDHLGGFREILDRYRISYILSDNLTNDSPLYQNWLEIIFEKQILSLPACAGQKISIGKDISISVLNPKDTQPTTSNIDINDRSVVLQIQAGKISFLLTGDLGTNGEKELMRGRVSLKSTILKVGHHGSASSTSNDFLKIVSPDIAVISAGQNNHYGHPNPQVYQSLQQQLGENNIFRTDRDGTIEFITNGTRLWIKTDR